ncbi:hypothetical protein LSH36_23g06032 [Paralvinella palmiformis]|uniref:FLYWCH-type domain-containing protein n=1 Tax=Paralvinella palmiformis TaxID=53620 RepID=A0AAD9KCC2_9ANNE|nr:hypothetical protein LSH36_23g06032 [Paralvinella palmiformis]
MEVITTKRDGQKICLDGSMYTQKHVAKSADHIVWRCVKHVEKTKCLSLLKNDNGQEADENVIIFATDNQLEQLAQSVWCMDGTFDVAPSLFSQLYVIQGRVNSVFLTLVKEVEHAPDNLGQPAKHNVCEGWNNKFARLPGSGLDLIKAIALPKIQPD